MRPLLVILQLVCFMAGLFTPSMAPTLVCRFTGKEMQTISAVTSPHSCCAIKAVSDGIDIHFALANRSCCDLRQSLSKHPPLSIPLKLSAVCLSIPVTTPIVLLAPLVENTTVIRPPLFHNDPPRGPPPGFSGLRAPPTVS